MAEPLVARMVQFTIPAEYEEAYIYPIGDLHLGDPACDLAKLYGYLNHIKSIPNGYILLNGDLANIATRASVSDVYAEEYPVREQRKRLVSMFEPVRDRIIAMTGGNHELRLSRETGDDFNETLAMMLGIESRYKVGEVYIKLSVGEHRERGRTQEPVHYSIYMTHGSRGGRRAGATANQLEDLASIVDADIYVAGHTHKKMVFAAGFHRIDINHATVRATKHLHVSTGGYLKREGYPIEKGYAPTWLGSARIRVDGRKKDAHASV